MYFRAKNAGTALVCVQLMKSLCLPVLLYAVEVLPLTKSEIAKKNNKKTSAVKLKSASASYRFQAD